jgi:galactokinase
MFKLDELQADARKDWSDYLRGVLAELREDGVPLRGCDAEIVGNVPLGAGLSSSASLEVAFALAMSALGEHAVAPQDLALLAQRAEIRFVGTRCGIMDQFTVLHARAGHALFLDTRSLDYRLIEVPAGIAIVICNTMVKHELSSSAYNERRRQCEQAVGILQHRDSRIRALRDVTPQMLQAAGDLLPHPLYARAHHVVTENARVERAVEALQRGELQEFGALMYASHSSLRDDYEVSCGELDLLVDLAANFPGVMGARMTGGGFGGCTVTIVEAKQAAGFAAYVRQAYAKATGIVPEIYDGTPSGGACLLHG